MKKSTIILMLGLIAGMLLQLPVSALASSSTPAKTKIMVNGSVVDTDLMLQNNRTMVPLIFFRHIGAAVTWDGSSRKATVSAQGMSIDFGIGRSYAEVTHNGGPTRREYQYTTNVIHEGRAYVPLAYTARKLGLTVGYDSAKKQVTIDSAIAAASSARSAQSSEFNPLTVVTQAELNSLYNITQAEAGGESFEGMVAVAAVIMNRVKSPNWPNTIKGAIFHVETFNGTKYYQFSPVKTGFIHNVRPSEKVKQAVHAALQGDDPSRGALMFYNPRGTSSPWLLSRPVTVRIGGHVFAK